MYRTVPLSMAVAQQRNASATRPVSRGQMIRLVEGSQLAAVFLSFQPVTITTFGDRQIDKSGGACPRSEFGARATLWANLDYLRHAIFLAARLATLKNGLVRTRGTWSDGPGLRASVKHAAKPTF
jgi:hypothetical protein